MHSYGLCVASFIERSRPFNYKLPRKLGFFSLGAGEEERSTEEDEEVCCWLEKPNPFFLQGSCVSLLLLHVRQGIDVGSPSEGRETHARIVSRGLDRDIYATNLLVQMYGRCCDLEAAQKLLFGGSRQKPNLVSWNSLISAYARIEGYHHEALQILRWLVCSSEGLRPNKFTFTSCLSASASLRLLPEGKWVHALISASGIDLDTVAGTALVDMYGKCGSLKGACAAFSRINSPDAVTWNALITAHAHNGHPETVLQLLEEMLAEGVKPNRPTFLALLNASSTLGSLSYGRAIHCCIVDSDSLSDSSIANAVLTMYGKLGSLLDAWQVFNTIKHPNVTSWNSIIATCAQHGYGERSLELLHQMVSEGITPTRITLFSALDACTTLASIGDGRVTHLRIIAVGIILDDVALRNALINMYGKCGCPSHARDVFDGMCQRDIVSWNSIISVYAQIGHGEEALRLSRQMDLEGVKADRITFLSIIDACASMESLEYGRAIHRHIGGGLKTDITLGNALINMYGKCGSLNEAQAVFLELPQRDAISWNAIIEAYGQNGQIKEALELSQKMYLENIRPEKITFLSILDACASMGSLENGRVIHLQIVASGFKSDVALLTSLVHMYAKCDSLKNGQAVFEAIRQPNIITWNIMIAAYAKACHSIEALKLFHQMNYVGFKPDIYTYLGILDACAAGLEFLKEGRMIHKSIISRGFETDFSLQKALVVMYAKCGDLKDARTIFDRMNHLDVVSWTAMIAAYAQKGQCEESFELLERMSFEGIKPDKVTFLSLLDACATQASLVHGRAVHEFLITGKFELDVVLGTALLNMYGKCGSVKDAWTIFQAMPRDDVVLWNAMIVAYGRNGHTKEALELFQQMILEGVISNSVTFIILLHACSHAGLLAEGQHYFHFMGEDYGILPSANHYACIIDLLGRAGHLLEAEELVNNMPMELDAISWTTLTGACWAYVDED